MVTRLTHKLPFLFLSVISRTYSNNVLSIVTYWITDISSTSSIDPSPKKSDMSQIWTLDKCHILSWCLKNWCTRKDTHCLSEFALTIWNKYLSNLWPASRKRKLNNHLLWEKTSVISNIIHYKKKKVSKKSNHCSLSQKALMFTSRSLFIRLSLL